VSQFILPKGREFTFNVTVYEADSFLPQNLDNVSAIQYSMFRLDDASTKYIPSSGPSTLTGTVKDSTNGIITFVITDNYSSDLEIERGPKVDNYYIKPSYEATIYISFSDDTPDKFVKIPKVYVSSAGV